MKKKWIVGVLISVLLPVAVAAQNSYTANPGNGSLFGGSKESPATSSSSVSSNFHTGNWGIGLRLGIAENNPKDMKETYDEAFDYGFSQKELSRSGAVYGIEALYEWTLNDELNKLGVKVGVEGYGKNELKLDWNTDKAKENTVAYPFTLYYKRDNGIQKWSFLAGAGLTIINSSVKLTGPDWVETGKYSKTKVFPHLMAGAEYRVSKLFAVGLEARYNIAAKVKKDGMILSDRSGFGAMVTGRFYF